MTISRRDVLKGTTAVMAGGFSLSAKAPAFAQAVNSTLRFIPQANLSSIDPLLVTGYVVRNHGYMVYDTLFAMDTGFNIRPQMAEGYEVSSDGLSYIIKLRAGLKFHDGEPVRASDCVASIRRWSARDALGQSIAALTDEMAAIDDRSFRIRLKQPFPLLIAALGKPSTPVPFIQPERIASAGSTVQIKDATGSGPFRFLPNEWVPGSRAAYQRFDGYVPRDEQPSGSAGGKKAYLDRVEWHIIPDPATASAALARGEVDWYEKLETDLIPLLQKTKDVVVTAYDDLGSMAILRFNHLHPPFDNVKVRRAVLAGLNQTEFMTAMFGDASRFRECKSFFACGTPMSTGTGSEAMAGNLDKARQLLKESGYAGEKVVLISPADLPWLHTSGLMAADLMKNMGMNVELASIDLGTLFSRRSSQEAPEKGGWNVFMSGGGAVDFFSPAFHLVIRTNGRAGWPGWPDDPAMERLRAEWLVAAGDAERLALARRIEAQAFSSVPYIPVGQYQSATAMRSNVTGVLKAPGPFAWNVKKG